jgi:hypothetical protein
MHWFWVLTLLLPLTLMTPGCGSGNSNRQLQSISIKAVRNGQQVQFLATGTFSAPPTAVSPLPVFWTFAPPDPQYTLTTQPFLLSCEQPESPGPIVAMAPANPDAPSSGSISTTRMVTTSGPISCPAN